MDDPATLLNSTVLTATQRAGVSVLAERLSGLPASQDDRTNWVVLTGAPAAGKSSVLSRLSARGLETRPEQARIYIENTLKLPKGREELSINPTEAVEQIFAMNRQQAEKSDRRKLTVFDRSLVDVLAFALIDNVPTDSLIDICGSYRFSQAFVFSGRPDDDDGDPVRYHDKRLADATGAICEILYRALGVAIKAVPSMSSSASISIETRTRFVISHMSPEITRLYLGEEPS